MTAWSLVYQDFEPSQEGLREALCTLGNGYFATRGAAPESAADDIHYPGTYLAGGYNRLRTEIGGRVVENEDLVNLPNWLSLRFRVAGGNWFNLMAVDLLAYRQELNIKEGILHRAIRFRDKEGRITRLQSRRFVSMRQPHLAGLETRLLAENWSGPLEIRTALDGRVVNAGVRRYQALNNKHLQPLETETFDGESIYLKVKTQQSQVHIAQAARTRVLFNQKVLVVDRELIEEPGFIAHQFGLQLSQGAELTLEKMTSLFTSRDHAISECGLEAREALTSLGRFDDLLGGHIQAWAHLWSRFDIGIQNSQATDQMTMILHLHLFHLLQTTSTHTMDLDVGVPARGWHGEAYRGHIFWDELFIFPLLNFRIPEITRALLKYRFRRLNQARAAATRAGYRGAMYPWQSGSTGREETQQLHLNPKSGRWIPDRSHRQRHVNAVIVYNIWQYYQVTRDMWFLSFSCAEIVLEIARFWASLSSYNPGLNRYEILGVMGPDEYHDGYPEQEEGGINNNAFTNVMAVWVLCRALELLNLLSPGRRNELCEKLGLEQEELERWQEISQKMRLVFHDGCIISQFEGYDQLEEFDWDGYRTKYGDIQRLDRILEGEGDSANRHKVSKQADVLMLFYLFSSEELSQLFQQLGYPFDYETIPKNIDYYLKRTAHGSTLSRIVHSRVLARSDRAASWKLFRDALESDVADIQGGTTPEGIHLGAMAGTVDLLQSCYTGLSIRGDVLWFGPGLPEELTRLQIQLHYRGYLLEVEIDRSRLKLKALRGGVETIAVGFKDQVYQLKEEDTKEFSLQ